MPAYISTVVIDQRFNGQLLPEDSPGAGRTTLLTAGSGMMDPFQDQLSLIFLSFDHDQIIFSFDHAYGYPDQIISPDFVSSAIYMLLLTFLIS